MHAWMNEWINKEKRKFFFMAECQLKIVGRIMDLENYLTTHITKVISGEKHQWMLKVVGVEKQDTYITSE